MSTVTKVYCDRCKEEAPSHAHGKVALLNIDGEDVSIPGIQYANGMPATPPLNFPLDICDPCGNALIAWFRGEGK